MSKSIRQHVKNIYAIQTILQKDSIVDAVSRMVKDMSHETVGGMMQVPAHHIQKLDELLLGLQKIENEKPQ